MRITDPRVARKPAPRWTDVRPAMAPKIVVNAIRLQGEHMLDRLSDMVDRLADAERDVRRRPPR